LVSSRPPPTKPTWSLTGSLWQTFGGGNIWEGAIYGSGAIFGQLLGVGRYLGEATKVGVIGGATNGGRVM